MFELSSEDRLRILQQLRKQATNVTNLSKKLNLTTQESSRHVSRLSDVGLTQKDSSGAYNLTIYGKLILKQLEGLAFASKNRTYFASHSLTNIPSDFVRRIGDLTASTYVNDISAAFFKVERLMQEAQEYIWAITDHYMVSTLPLWKELCDREVKTRNIEAESWVVPLEIKEKARSLPWYQKATSEARETGLLEERLLKRLDVYLYMSEKEVAVIGFPLSQGTFDYLGFTSRDKESRKWCGDLFEYYWKKARNRENVAEELYQWISKKPEAAHALRYAATGEKTLRGKEQISELESRSLMKEGKLTNLGDIVLLRLDSQRH